MKKLLLLVCLVSFLPQLSQALGVPTQTDKNSYYSDAFYQAIQSGIVNDDLRRVINNEMRNHLNVGYDRARVFLLGQFYLVNRGKGYAVKDVYCDREVGAEEFPSKGRPGPNVIPDNTVVNTEHTWPQSRFNPRVPKDLQKADLHHLFPTDTQVNALRGNKKFGIVNQETQQIKCAGPRYGQGQGQRDDIFEPPQDHKGNVARALFYFSVKYGLRIDPIEEATLRKWAQEDPVDDEEMRRNNEIQKVQVSRNPFIDYPDLADRIQDF